MIDGQTVYEIDYCSVPAGDDEQCLEFTEDGSIAKPFPDNIWLTEKAEKITEFYVLYQVKPRGLTYIRGVQPADSETIGGCKINDWYLID